MVEHSLPAGQTVQAVAPPVANVPAGHAVHAVWPPRLKVPLGQATGLAVVEAHWEPAGQIWHVPPGKHRKNVRSMRSGHTTSENKGNRVRAVRALPKRYTCVQAPGSTNRGKCTPLGQFMHIIIHRR